MPRFNYVALDARGQESTGLMEAGSPNEVIGQLRQAGYFPTSVFEEGKGAARDGKAQKAAAKKAARTPKVRGAKKEITLFQREENEAKAPDDFHTAACDPDRLGVAPPAKPDSSRETGARQSSQENDQQTFRRRAKWRHFF